MMFAETENLDVLHNYQLVMILVKDGIVHNILYILLISLREAKQSFGISLWCLEKPFSVWVFTYAFKDGPYSATHFL